MKLAIIGSRGFDDYALMDRAIFSHWDPEWGGSWPELIISGGADGADNLAEAFAQRFKIRTQIFLPDWATHGKLAGFVRNKLIIEACDEVLAFWDGKSKGTANSLSIAKRLKKPTIIIYF